MSNIYTRYMDITRSALHARPESLSYTRYYCRYNGKAYPAYQDAGNPDPDNNNWYIIIEIPAMRSARMGNPVYIPAKHKRVNVSKNQVYQKQASFTFKYSQNDKAVKEQKNLHGILEGLGVKAKGITILTEGMCDDDTLRFMNTRHSKEFFTELLTQIDQVYPDISGYMMYLFDNVINKRYSHKDLSLSLKDFEPDNLGLNESEVFLCQGFKQVMVEIYNKLHKKHVGKFVVFPHLGKAKFSKWPRNERNRFYWFCKKHSDQKTCNAIKEKILAEEIKLGWWDKLCVSLTGFDIINPGCRMADVRKSVYALGPCINKKKEMKAFYRKHKSAIRSGKLHMFMLPHLDGGRIVLVKNDPKIQKQFKKQVSKMAMTQATNEIFSPKGISEAHPLRHLFEKMDEKAFEGIANIKTDSKELLLAAFGLYAFFMGVRDIVEFTFNPYSWWEFIISLQDMGQDFKMIGEVFMREQNEAQSAVVVCMLAGVLYGGKVSHSLHNALNNKIKAKMLLKNIRSQTRAMAGTPYARSTSKTSSAVKIKAKRTRMPRSKLKVFKNRVKTGKN
ncbi:MAG: hypothetical protein ABIH00_11380 [Armatimonadota bacterium]